jgi:hypothetical protein
MPHGDRLFGGVVESAREVAVWVQIIESSIFFDALPREGVQTIPYAMPLTAADGILLLVGALMHLEEEAARVGARSGQLRREDVKELGDLMSVSGECQAAMFRIRKEQFDAYMKPAPLAGGKWPRQ